MMTKVTPETCPYVDLECGMRPECIMCSNEEVHMDRTYELSDIKAFLKEAYPRGVQMFDTHNTGGDRLIEIYSTGGVSILFAPFFGYIEIFGLTHEQFLELESEFGIYYTSEGFRK